MIEVKIMVDSIFPFSIFVFSLALFLSFSVPVAVDLFIIHTQYKYIILIWAVLFAYELIRFLIILLPKCNLLYTVGAFSSHVYFSSYCTEKLFVGIFHKRCNSIMGFISISTIVMTMIMKFLFLFLFKLNVVLNENESFSSHFSFKCNINMRIKLHHKMHRHHQINSLFKQCKWIPTTTLMNETIYSIFFLKILLM